MNLEAEASWSSGAPGKKRKEIKKEQKNSDANRLLVKPGNDVRSKPLCNSNSESDMSIDIMTARRCSINRHLPDYHYGHGRVACPSRHFSLTFICSLLSKVLWRCPEGNAGVEKPRRLWNWLQNDWGTLIPTRHFGRCEKQIVTMITK